ncbi:MAG TPA: redoxin domain-containing protein [Gemmatimonadaceae bacterium]|nr:redoxin domain-containing protein [Gemmatimonadaceae bacterium]
MTEPQLPGVGSPAPAFTAQASDDRTVSLSGLLESGPVVLIFYPANDTAG